MRIQERAYAKINLYLDVLCRREDGFHGLRSVMQSVSLADTVRITAKPASHLHIRLCMVHSSLPCDARNLAYRAAVAYANAAEISFDAYIRIEKHIPVGAGLAGGSSDAAAVLRGLNRIFGRLSPESLDAVAATLGSDINFCLHGGTRLCTERGECTSPAPSPGHAFYVLKKPAAYVSTPEAFRALDARYLQSDGSFCSPGGEEKYASFLRSADNLYNIFEDVILPTCPEASFFKQQLLQMGASATLMSGSGPTVFGVFRTYAAARRAAKKTGGILCRPVS